MSSTQSLISRWLRSRLPVSREENRHRAAFIHSYEFPPEMRQRFAANHPQLTAEQWELAWGGLREYFQLCRMAGRAMVAMPSEAADAVWHEFILWTREYQAFCDAAFGRFLHHAPAAGTARWWMNDAYWRAWRLACARAKLNPANASVLPALFALDAQLGYSGAAPDPVELSRRNRRASGASSSSCSGSSCSSGTSNLTGHGNYAAPVYGGSCASSDSGHGHGASAGDCVDGSQDGGCDSSDSGSSCSSSSDSGSSCSSSSCGGSSCGGGGCGGGGD